MRTEFQDLNCLHLNRLPNRATLIPYPDRDSARRNERALSPYFCDLNGEWDFTYYASPLDVEQLSGDVFAVTTQAGRTLLHVGQKTGMGGETQ